MPGGLGEQKEEGRGRRAAISSVALPGTQRGVQESGDSMEPMSSLCPRGGVRAPSAVEAAQQALRVCSSTCSWVFGKPTQSVFPVRHTRVYASSLFLGTSCHLLTWYYHYHCFAKQTF